MVRTAGKVIFLPAFPELGWRIVGTVVGVALGIVTAVWEAVLTPWYTIISGHVVRVPAAPLLAIVCNIGLVWFTRKVTGRTGPALLPGLAWLGVMVAAGDLTSDGDLLVEGTWVGLSTILLGAVAWAVAGYMAILRPGRTAPARAVPAPVGPAAKPASKRASESSATVTTPAPGSRPKPGARPAGSKGKRR
jgi:hypothetical protein